MHKTMNYVCVCLPQCVFVTLLLGKQQRKKQRLLMEFFHIFLGLEPDSFCLWVGVLLDRLPRGHSASLCYRRQAMYVVFITAGTLQSQLKHSTVCSQII